MKTVVMNAGHGGTDPGATYNGRQEKDDALKMSLAVGKVLKSNGVNVVQTRITDVFVSLQGICDIEKVANADIFCSIHRNAFEPEKAKGVETYSLTTTGTGRDLANQIQNNMVNLGVTVDRGIKTANYYILKNTNAPAVLVEVGFIDNTEDNKMFDAKFNEYAVAIAKAILSKLGISYNGNTDINNSNSENFSEGVIAYGRVIASVLNVRDGAGTGYKTIGTLNNGTEVKIGSTQVGWHNIFFGNHGGWISSDYVEITKKACK